MDTTLEALGGFISTLPGTRTDSSSHTEAIAAVLGIGRCVVNEVLIVAVGY